MVQRGPDAGVRPVSHTRCVRSQLSGSRSSLDSTGRFPSYVRSLRYSASDASCQSVSERAVGWQWLLHLNGTCGGQAVIGCSDRTHLVATPDTSGAHDLRVRSSRNLPSEGVTAILAHGAINRSVGRPLAMSLVELSTLEPWWLMWWCLGTL